MRACHNCLPALRYFEYDKMTKVVKCNSCNIIIDEMLAYIQNKISVIDEETLLRICTSSFSSEQIETSKELLFEAVSVDNGKIKRRNKGKEQRNLVDIVNVFKSTEPDKFPIFVAKDLERLPPILFDHLDCTKLLKDLLLVQNELKEIRSTYVTYQHLSELKTEILKGRSDSLIPLSACKINKKQGGWMMDSGPIGLSHLPDLHDDEYNDAIDEINLPELMKTAHQRRKISEVDENSGGKTLTVEQSSSGRGAVTSPVHTASFTPKEVHSNKNISGPPAPITAPAPPAPPETIVQTEESQGWQTVSSRRKVPNYRYLGNKGNCKDYQGKFKAVEKRYPIFITKIHKDTSEKDITDYIFEKTKQLITLEKITFRQEREHNAYKFFVPEEKLSLFLDSELWPQGIIFRRFVNFKPRKPNGVNAATAHGQYRNTNG